MFNKLTCVVLAVFYLLICQSIQRFFYINIFRYLNVSFPFYLLSLQTYQRLNIIIVWCFASRILCFLHGCRKERTKEENNIIMPAFDEVCASINMWLNVQSKKSKKFKLYIDNSMNINSYAIGSNTVVITRGAIYHLTEVELKGVFAHEIGHLRNGDALVKLMVNMGFVFSVPLMILARMIEKISNNQGKRSFIISLIIFVTFPFRLISLKIDRKSEYLADKFAFNLGYGEHLKHALYKMSCLENNANTGLMDRLMNSHPDIFLRIVKLEKSLDLR